MTDSEFLEDRARQIFDKFRSFIPEEHQSSVLNELILGMFKAHIDVVQNLPEDAEEEEDD